MPAVAVGVALVSILNTPNLNGNWEGYLTSSYSDHNTEYPVRIVISQTWSKISVLLGIVKLLSYHLFFPPYILSWSSSEICSEVSPDFLCLSS